MILTCSLSAVSSSIKNAEDECDPAMRQTNEGSNWFFGMKAHIGVESQSVE